RLPVRGPPATGRFRQKSTVDGRLREIDCRRSIEEEKGKNKRKRKKKKRGSKNTSLARRPHPPAVAARHRLLAIAPRGSPACGHRPRPLFLPREETERLPARGDRSRRRDRTRLSGARARAATAAKTTAATATTNKLATAARCSDVISVRDED
ncbi:hypothetical protein BHE74_00049883, partial [Ensete ventricosum]